MVLNILTPSSNFFYNHYSTKYFITSNRPIPIETAKNIVTSINNNAFIYSLTNNTEPNSIKPGTVRYSNKVNIENLTVNINFLNCYFNNNR